jgi:hypothetical protein
MFIYPYIKGSKSAKSLGQSLGCKVLTRPKARRKGLVINWGASEVAPTRVSKMLNAPYLVKTAANKLDALKVFKENNIACPDFTTDINIAKTWIEEGETVVCRTLLRSHSGKGIVIANEVSELVAASLYVKYFNKTYEFRVHVFNGKVIDSVQKRKRSGVESNKYVRSYNNGWVFCRDNNKITIDARMLAIKAVTALGLDFGACDIVMKKNGECKVLEVNTAPALIGTTLESYKNAIMEYINE